MVVVPTKDAMAKHFVSLNFSVNQRLRNGLLAVGLTRTPLGLAEQGDVDEKTVERWITKDRIPHPNTRARIVTVLG